MRPKKGDEKYKGKIVNIRMTETDYIRIQKIAKRSKATSISDFMRRASIQYAEDYEKLIIIRNEKNPIIRNTMIDSLIEKRTIE